VRDVSDLRERDRLLVSKDATIREIHHRVKNNLQTISSLLRLQGRRLREPSAIAAIEESVRRIRSIALVHETLSREVGDDVPFRDVIRPLVRMVEEGLVSPDRPVRFRIDGDVGVVPSAIATPLALVVTELLQNVVEHAYPESVALADQGAEVVVALRRDDHGVCITMVDNGVGVPDALEVGSPSSLGLTIVDTLVTTELRGTIEIGRGSAPLPRPGTRIEVRVPTGGPADW
jgi:two-component sensor histidine kinase